MRSVRVDPAKTCVDCRASRTPQPHRKTPRSVRCEEHQRDWDRHLTKRRNALKRSRRNPDLAPVPSLDQWKAMYRPRRLGSNDSAYYLAVLDPNDREQIANVLDDLLRTLVAAMNDLNQDDAEAFRRGLKALHAVALETYTVLVDIPGMREVLRPGSRP